MELLRRIIAASIIAAGLAAPVFSCPGAAVPQAGCALQVAADVPPCHRSAAPPQDAPDCEDMLCCRPDYQDRVSADRLELRPSWQTDAAFVPGFPAQKLPSARTPAGHDPPAGHRFVFHSERLSRAPPVLA
jgi:hypothetical protein